MTDDDPQDSKVSSSQRNILTFLKTPRLAQKLDTVRLAAESASKLKLEVQKVNAVTGFSQLHRQPCLVTICTLDSKDLGVKCLTPNPGRTRDLEFSYFLSHAGKKLGIKGSKAYVITKLLERHDNILEILAKLRSDQAKISRFQIFDLDSISSGDVILIEDTPPPDVELQPKPAVFDFGTLRSSIPLLQDQFLRTLSSGDDERREHSRLAALPRLEGFVIAGHLGRGGIRGYSYLARDERGFEVVLKEYLPDRLLGTRELSACLNSQRHCMLEHPNIFPVREFFVADGGVHAATSCWSVQEYFALRSVLDQVARAAVGILYAYPQTQPKSIIPEPNQPCHSSNPKTNSVGCCSLTPGPPAAGWSILSCFSLLKP